VMVTVYRDAGKYVEKEVSLFERKLWLIIFLYEEYNLYLNSWCLVKHRDTFTFHPIVLNIVKV
jgi:hypothetical protein